MAACRTTEWQGQSAMIVGIVTRDILVFTDSTGTSVQIHSGYGGIIHSAIACIRNGIKVDLVSCFDNAAQEAVSVLFEMVGTLDLSCAHLTSLPLPRCSLFWAPEAIEPVEQTTLSGLSIPNDHLLNLIRKEKSRVIYINMTTGHDLSRQTLEAIIALGHHIYLDPHMLLYSTDVTGARYLCPPEDWKSWLSLGDILQLNEVEFETVCKLAGLPAGSFHERASALIDQLRSFHKIPWAVIRTMRDHIDVIYDDGHRWEHVKRPTIIAAVPHPAYTVGCGDAFGAGVFCGLLSNWAPQGLISGLDLGIQWASENSRALGIYYGQEAEK